MRRKWGRRDQQRDRVAQTGSERATQRDDRPLGDIRKDVRPGKMKDRRTKWRREGSSLASITSCLSHTDAMMQSPRGPRKSGNRQPGLEGPRPGSRKFAGVGSKLSNPAFTQHFFLKLGGSAYAEERTGACQTPGDLC
jgi:hypothetical protein